MNWFSKLLGRDSRPAADPAGDILVDMPRRARRGALAGDLPSFRNPAGPIARRFVRSGAADARSLIRDAFTPSQPVNDRAMFAGRRALLTDLITAVEDQRLHFVLYGDRGIGKTSILHVLSDLASDAEYLVTYISCGDRMSFSDFARRIARRVPLLHHRDYLPGSPEIERGMTLADILPEGDIDVSTFSEQLGQLSDTRLLLLLDEFDRVESEDFRRSIAELIKNLSDTAAPAQLVIAGVAADLTELIAQIPSIRRNVLGVLVPNMTDAEVVEMLGIAERRAGLTFADDARELIAMASLGLPYVVGLVSQHAALLSTDRGESVTTRSDVKDAVRKARSEISGRLAATTLYAVSQAIQNGQLIELGRVAHAALRNGGVVPEEAILASLRSGADGRASTPLLAPLAGDPLSRWHFTDDGASVFIWLSALSAD